MPPDSLPAPAEPPATVSKPLLVTDREAAALLSIARATLHRRRAAGQFPPGVKIGRCLRFKVADLESFIDCNCDIVRWRALQAMRDRRERRGG